MMFVEKTHDDGMYDEVGPCLRASFQGFVPGLVKGCFIASMARLPNKDRRGYKR